MAMRTRWCTIRELTFVVCWENAALRRVYFGSVVSSYFVDTTLAAALGGGRKPWSHTGFPESCL
jgi:hypothetical protein